ncbi:unnamed protein product [Closterium sp. Naga37s-1]|nr:unnamed protein product [Closterium sp. Naga37s-1]
MAAGDSRLTQPRGSSSNPQAARNASHTAQNAVPNPTAAAELPLPSFHVDVAIAGGGLAGLALAAGLQARGIEAAVFEAAPAARRSNNRADIAEEGGAVQQQRELVVVRAKILVAADGVRSAVRNQMIGDSPRYLEQFGWNARVPSQPSGDVSQQQNRTVLSFKDAVTGYQLFHTAGFHSETVSAADPDGQLKAELEQTPFGGFGKPGVKDRLMCHVSKHIADPSAHDTWHTVLQAVTTTDPGNIYERWMMDRPPPKDSWSDSKCGNRVVLMGDAAHAMHPELGQGAQTAFEDAHQLSLCLAEIKDVLAEPAAVAAAVREYEDWRIDRCVRIHAYATAAHGFGEEARLVRELSPPEKSKLFMEFQKWILAYPDKIKGDPESTYFK